MPFFVIFFHGICIGKIYVNLMCNYEIFMRIFSLHMCCQLVIICDIHDYLSCAIETKLSKKIDTKYKPLLVVNKGQVLYTAVPIVAYLVLTW